MYNLILGSTIGGVSEVVALLDMPIEIGNPIMSNISKQLMRTFIIDSRPAIDLKGLFLKQ